MLRCKTSETQNLVISLPNYQGPMISMIQEWVLANFTYYSKVSDQRSPNKDDNWRAYMENSTAPLRKPFHNIGKITNYSLPISQIQIYTRQGVLCTLLRKGFNLKQHNKLHL